MANKKTKKLYDLAEVAPARPLRSIRDDELDYLAGLREQAGRVLDDRQASYAAPSASLRAIASVWTGILNYPVTQREVALCLAGLKLVREVATHSDDNILDGINYLAMAGLDGAL